MTNLKRSFFAITFYLAIIFVLGQADYSSRPIINFASYFYLVVIVAIPLTLFFPAISRVSSFVPLFVWAGIYLVILQIGDRSLSSNVGEFSVIILEFILLEAGVWFAYQLALQISHAESVMDALALNAFPSSAREIEEESQRIKVELSRSRRYHRPLSLVIIESENENRKLNQELLRSMQYDLTNRFASARIGQIIDDKVRQTDLVMRDRRRRFVILCPETDLASITELAKRIAQAVKERVDVRVRWGVAAFPEEALTFDDLLNTARERLIHSVDVSEEQVVALNFSE
jgi:GGDEF domain-containing protein